MPSVFQRDRLTTHSADLRQFIDFRASTLPNGLRIIDAHNSSGLAFSVLPDRGLDIWSATFNGLPLTWLAMGAPFHPDVGQSWLRTFNGGLLVTCGLTHAGAPEHAPITDGGRELHGLYSSMRAYNVAVTGGWEDETAVLELRGTVAVGALSCEQLRLERVYRLTLGEPVITWQDRVTNAGIKSEPLMVLYHINFGYPLVQSGTQMHSPYHAVIPRDDEARKGVQTWATYEAARPDYLEQVFFHHVKADADGYTRALLAHDELGVELAWHTGTLPYLTQWKNTRQGFYVCGIEPGNCIPEGQVAARDSGRLVMIEPGQSVEYGVSLRVLGDTDAVQEARDHIDMLRLEGAPVEGVDLTGYA